MVEMSDVIVGLNLDELPQRRGIRAVWKELKEYMAVSDEQGELVTVSMAARLLGVTETRIGQLILDGTLRTWRFNGRRWLSGAELAAFVKMQRPSGIPTRKPSGFELWKMSQWEAKKMLREREKKKRDGGK
jgi:excisionase family DNA binding protein